jgi:hypothetical protein
VDWVESREEEIGVLFTPWGEALHHRSYQQAITRLSHLPNVWKVAIQTNLSAPLSWLSGANLTKAALWATWHPQEVSRERFVKQCQRADALGVRYSVGVVGVKEAFADIEALRADLLPEVYLWVNAWKREAGYYTEAEIERVVMVDPLFRYNVIRHPSLGQACRAGHTTFSVDGEGDVRRCHFIPAVLGNIYQPNFRNALQRKPCTNSVCGCHIGYVHLEPLDLYQVFGDGVLERIPQG